MRFCSSLASFSLAFALTSLNSPVFANTEACTLERHGEIPLGDAETAADLVCSAAIERLPQCTPFRVRLGRLEHQIVVTLIAECNPHGAPHSARERRLVLSGLDEIPVAAPRLAEALASDVTLGDTQTVDNLVSSETRVPKRKPAEAHATLGLVGAVVPTTGTTTAGTRLGFSFGSPRWAFTTDLTLTGRALVNTFGGFLYILPKDSSRDYSHLFQQSGSGFASISAGGRLYMSDLDVSPFIGGGFAFDWIGIPGANGDAARSGLAGCAELGVDALRTHQVGGTISLRADLPAFFILDDDQASPLPRRTYAPVVSATIALRF